MRISCTINHSGKKEKWGHHPSVPDGIWIYSKLSLPGPQKCCHMEGRIPKWDWRSESPGEGPLSQGLDWEMGLATPEIEEFKDLDLRLEVWNFSTFKTWASLPSHDHLSLVSKYKPHYTLFPGCQRGSLWEPRGPKTHMPQQSLFHWFFFNQDTWVRALL